MKAGNRMPVFLQKATITIMSQGILDCMELSPPIARYLACLAHKKVPTVPPNYSGKKKFLYIPKYL